MEVWSLFKLIHGDTEKARAFHICIIGNACDLLFYYFGKPISTILKEINFYQEFTQGFRAFNYAVV